jgi:VIT1/CCC1 family predicted Fe2+/Mn2+ transporter
MGAMLFDATVSQVIFFILTCVVFYSFGYLMGKK